MVDLIVVNPLVPSCNELVVVDTGWLESPPKVKPVAGVLVVAWFCNPALVVKPVFTLVVADWVGWFPKAKPVEDAPAAWLDWLPKVNPVAAEVVAWLDWFPKVKPVVAVLAYIIRKTVKIILRYNNNNNLALQYIPA